MSSLSDVRNHLTAISHGAHQLQRTIAATDGKQAAEMLELIRHIHGAIEALTNVVEKMKP